MTVQGEAEEDSEQEWFFWGEGKSAWMRGLELEMVFQLQSRRRSSIKLLCILLQYCKLHCLICFGDMILMSKTIVEEDWRSSPIQMVQVYGF